MKPMVLSAHFIAALWPGCKAKCWAASKEKVWPQIANKDSKSEEWVHKMPDQMVAGNFTKAPVIQPDNTEPKKEIEPPKTEEQKKAE